MNVRQTALMGQVAGAAGGMPPRQPQTQDVVGLAAGADPQFVLLRDNIRQKIIEFIRRKPMSADWRRRLPELASRLEEILFRKHPNKTQYCNIAKGPIQPYLYFALRFLTADLNRQQQQSQQIASSPGCGTMILSPGITQGGAPDEHVNTMLSPGINPTQHDCSRESNNNNLVINIVDTPETYRLLPKVTEAHLAPPIKDLPREPKFSCPVCTNELVDASSTICGHIFCQKCIEASIQAQRKCPTCRRKLTMRSFHRVYLPKMD